MEKDQTYFWVSGKTTGGVIHAESIRAKDNEEAEAKFVAMFMDEDGNLSTEFKYISTRPETAEFREVSGHKWY